MSENTKKVDLVIVIDTSGSMKSTAEEISKAITGAVDEAKSSCPSDLRVDYLGIEGTFENTKFGETVRNYLTQKVGVDVALLKSRVRKSLAGAGANEDGARTVEDVSTHYDWREGAERAIFLLQDESLDAGEMVVTAEAIKANDNAIATALQHGVKVNTYLGAPHTPYASKQDEEAMIEEFKRLAEKTGGEHYIHTSGMANFKEVLKKTICASKVPQEESIENKEKPCGCHEGSAHGKGDCNAYQMQVGIIELDSKNASAIAAGNDSTFFTVSFPKAYPEGSQVVVFQQVQTFNGQDTPGIRISQVTHAGFKIRMNELVGIGQPLSDGTHTFEKIAWMSLLVV
jgi:hypothetical protein